MARNVVYTALFGDYDSLIDPLVKDTNVDCDFICFTDQPNLSSQVWDIRLVEDNDLPPNLLNRRYKMLPHIYLKDYDASLYIDANIGIKRDPSDLFNRLSKKSPVFIPNHPFRSCLYEELNVCEKEGKISSELKDQIHKKYLTEGLPKTNGLTENNIILRLHHHQRVVALMNEWWNLVLKFCPRDQITLPYLLWKMEMSVSLLKEDSKHPNSYFYFRPHKHSITGSNYLKKSLINISLRRADNYFYYFFSRGLDQASHFFISNKK